MVIGEIVFSANVVAAPQSEHDFQEGGFFLELAMFVDDIDRSLELLVDKGHQIITENDLSEDDEYI